MAKIKINGTFHDNSPTWYFKNSYYDTTNNELVYSIGCKHPKGKFGYVMYVLLTPGMKAPASGQDSALNEKLGWESKYYKKDNDEYNDYNKYNDDKYVKKVSLGDGKSTFILARISHQSGKTHMTQNQNTFVLPSEIINAGSFTLSTFCQARRNGHYWNCKHNTAYMTIKIGETVDKSDNFPDVCAITLASNSGVYNNTLNRNFTKYYDDSTIYADVTEECVLDYKEIEGDPIFSAKLRIWGHGGYEDNKSVEQTNDYIIGGNGGTAPDGILYCFKTPGSSWDADLTTQLEFSDNQKEQWVNNGYVDCLLTNKEGAEENETINYPYYLELGTEYKIRIRFFRYKRINTGRTDSEGNSIYEIDYDNDLDDYGFPKIVKRGGRDEYIFKVRIDPPYEPDVRIVNIGMESFDILWKTNGNDGSSEFSCPYDENDEEKGAENAEKNKQFQMNLRRIGMVIVQIGSKTLFVDYSNYGDGNGVLGGKIRVCPLLSEIKSIGVFEDSNEYDIWESDTAGLNTNVEYNSEIYVYGKTQTYSNGDVGVDMEYEQNHTPTNFVYDSIIPGGEVNISVTIVHAPQNYCQPSLTNVLRPITMANIVKHYNAIRSDYDIINYYIGEKLYLPLNTPMGDKKPFKVIAKVKNNNDWVEWFTYIAAIGSGTELVNSTFNGIYIVEETNDPLHRDNVILNSKLKSRLTRDSKTFSDTTNNKNKTNYTDQDLINFWDVVYHNFNSTQNNYLDMQVEIITPHDFSLKNNESESILYADYKYPQYIGGDGAIYTHPVHKYTFQTKLFIIGNMRTALVSTANNGNWRRAKVWVYDGGRQIWRKAIMLYLHRDNNNTLHVRRGG